MSQPDEGLIHAWLDGELPADEAARVEQLVATDAAWATAAAEARGLIAASARILSTLDDVPAQVIPASRPASTATTRRVPWWTRAAAAVLIVAGGSVLMLQRGGPPATTAPQAVVVSPVPSAPPTASDVARKDATMPRLAEGVRQEAAKPGTGAPSAATRARAAEAAAAPGDRATLAPPPLAAAPQVVAPSAMAPMREKLAQAPAAQATVPTVEPAREAVPALRTSADAAALRAEQVNAPVSAMAKREQEKSLARPATDARALGGVAAKAAPSLAACFMVRDAVTPRGDSLAMRRVRQVGDTVFLMANDAASAVRALILDGTGPRPGVWFTGPPSNSTVAIVATPTPCPTP